MSGKTASKSTTTADAKAAIAAGALGVLSAGGDDVSNAAAASPRHHTCDDGGGCAAGGGGGDDVHVSEDSDAELAVTCVLLSSSPAARAALAVAVATRGEPAAGLGKIVPSLVNTVRHRGACEATGTPAARAALHPAAAEEAGGGARSSTPSVRWQLLSCTQTRSRWRARGGIPALNGGGSGPTIAV